MKPTARRGFALLSVFIAFSFCVAAADKKPTNDDCLACHGESTLTKEINGKPVSLYVSPDKFNASIHGSMFSCVDCHTDIKRSMHEATPAKVSCAQCHNDQQTVYDRSLHAKAVAAGKTNAATCMDCHGSPHELLPAGDPNSKVNHSNIPATCGTCHGQKFVMQQSRLTTQPFVAYQESVHGRGIASGIMRSAVCTDCHGSHEILSAMDSKSPIFKFNVPVTCGKCHEPVQRQFETSIHGQAIAHGDWQAPVCTDCHGIHGIRAKNDPKSAVSGLNLAQATCSRCHESVRLSQEFGFDTRKATTYLSSYHGLASRLGSAVVANCASCHGAHNILPSSDPQSSVYPANLVKTCGQCHPGVNERFVAAKVHVDMAISQDKGSIGVRWVRRIYLVIILLVIGAMLLHNFLIWRWSALQERRLGEPQVLRMTPNQRWQHTVLLVSFIVLVITGFALKYPDSGLAGFLGVGERVRGIIHRLAGAVLIGSGIYHLAYIFLWREGRSLAYDMLPSREDMAGMRTNLLYHLGWVDRKPRFGRFNYAEKAEYWALLWGTIVMAVTGLMLWAKVFFGNILPRWWLDVATAVHFYEAVLATLAVIIWHFYHVFFDPEAHTMNWAWWDGKVPLSRYRETHPLDPNAAADGPEGGSTP
jgi:cytochrome b subunit of formate dehydrogenase